MKKRPFLALGCAALVAGTQAGAAEPERSKPVGDPGAWVTTDDYPSDALANGQQGTVGFVLSIDAQGAVTGCQVTKSSGVASLDAATCALIMRRARFSPAVGPDGEPVASTYSSRVRWAIPESVREPGRLVYAFDVLDDGSVVNCHALEATGSFASPDDGEKRDRGCENLRSDAYTDKAGKPIKVRVTVTQSVDVKPIP